MGNNTPAAPRRSGAPTCADIAVLLSGYLDGELTQQQAQHVRLHIDGCTHCRQIHDDLGRLKVQMQHLSWPQSDEDMLDTIGNDFTARTATVLGWSLLLVALLVFIGCLVVAFFSAPDDMFLLLAFYGLLILGGLGLFIAVLRQRFMIYKNDRYRKVKL